MLWIECDPLQVMSNAQAHQVVAGELLACQTIARRFTLRSKLKVDVQWTRTRFALVAQARNIGKIHAFGTLH
jgi:hypothetical protein